MAKKVKSNVQETKIGDVDTGKIFDDGNDGDETTPSQTDDPDMNVTIKRKRAKVQLKLMQGAWLMPSTCSVWSSFPQCTRWTQPWSVRFTILLSL